MIRLPVSASPVRHASVIDYDRCMSRFDISDYEMVTIPNYTLYCIDHTFINIHTRKRHGHCIGFNSLNYKVYECNYKNGVLHGKYIQYYDGGFEIRMIINYDNGVIDGPITTFYTNGKPKEVALFDKGLYLVTKKIWDKDGTLLGENIHNTYSNEKTFRTTISEEGDLFA
jgi:hypothetical protein